MADCGAITPFAIEDTFWRLGIRIRELIYPQWQNGSDVKYAQ